MRPIETRFGRCVPEVGKAIAALSAMWGETIVPCGAAAANCLGLTTRNPVRIVLLTSGPNRRLHLGACVVELRHALRWQLAAPHRKAGEIVRALAWLGPANALRCRPGRACGRAARHGSLDGGTAGCALSAAETPFHSLSADDRRHPLRIAQEGGDSKRTSSRGTSESSRPMASFSEPRSPNT